MVSENKHNILVVISYDISEDRRRNQIHKTLKNFGQRVQYSVFECSLSKIDHLKLQDRLIRLIKPEEQDSIRFYFLCAACQDKVERIGGTMPLSEGAIVI